MKTPSKPTSGTFLSNYLHLQDFGIFLKCSGFSRIFTIFSPAGLQIDLAQSSGGVGWSHGHHGIVISDRTFDLAGLERRRKPLNIISRVSVSFFAFLKHHLGYRRPPNDLLWNPVQSLCNELTRLNFIYHLSTKKRIARNWDWLGVRIFLC